MASRSRPASSASAVSSSQPLAPGQEHFTVQLLLDWRTPVATAVLYLAFVISSTWVSRRFLALDDGGRNWRPWFFGSDLKALSIVHDVVLVGSSAAMFVGCLYAVLQRIRRTGSHDFLFCEDPSWEFADMIPGSTTAIASVSDPYFWSFLYYASKYYELLDTVLQLARGRPPPNFFLHVYHHACVLVMAYAWVRYKMSLQFIGLLFNTFVHIVMYFYYLQRAVTKKTPSWKRAVTSLQVLQFLTSVVAFGYSVGGYVYVTNVEGQLGGRGYECAGWPWVMLGNIGFNLFLLKDFCAILRGGGRRKPPKEDAKKER
eukprot:g8034.t1